MDEVCITIFKGDVVVFPLELFCRPFVQVMDIGEWPLLCFPDIAVLGPTHLPDEMRSTKDRLDLTWGLRFWSIVLRSCPPVINVILKVPATNKLLYLIFKDDALLGGLIDAFMEPAVLILVPFGAVSM